MTDHAQAQQQARRQRLNSLRNQAPPQGRSRRLVWLAVAAAIPALALFAFYVFQNLRRTSATRHLESDLKALSEATITAIDAYDSSGERKGRNIVTNKEAIRAFAQIAASASTDPSAPSIAPIWKLDVTTESQTFHFYAGLTLRNKCYILKPWARPMYAPELRAHISHWDRQFSLKVKNTGLSSISNIVVRWDDIEEPFQDFEETNTWVTHCSMPWPERTPVTITWHSGTQCQFVTEIMSTQTQVFQVLQFHLFNGTASVAYGPDPDDHTRDYFEVMK